MRLRSFAMGWIGLLIGLLSVSCGGSTNPSGSGGGGGGGGAGLSASLVGTWNATRFEFVADANSSVTADLIPMGASVVVTIQSSGRYTIDQSMPGQPNEHMQGMMTVSGGTMTMVDDNDPANNTVASYSVSGTTLTVLSTDETFDFNGDGVDENADLHATFTKG